MKVGVVIPALNEERTVGAVVRGCRAALSDLCPVRVVVADNGSSDHTAAAAAKAGAEVVDAPRRGYGSACLRAIDHLGTWPDLLLFIDADGSSRTDEIRQLIDPIVTRQADMVVGSRPKHAPMTLPQKWGTWLAARLIGLRWGRHFKDIGPFRAVRADAYRTLGMKDQTWGWTVEMQILALIQGVQVVEVPVSWEERQGGVSKISGTVSGVVRAGSRIIWTLVRYAFTGSGSRACLLLF